MQAQKYVAIDQDLWERAGKVARAEGKTVDELASEALQRELGRRTLERLKREGEIRRQGMTDEQVEQVVEDAIDQVRQR